MFKSVFLALGALSTLALAGCSTALTDRQIEAMHTPTLTLNCETGCSAAYTDPRDRAKLPTNGWDTANAAINAAAGVATSVAPWAALGITATKGIAGAAGDNNSDNSVRTDNRTDSTHTPTIVESPAPEIVQPEIVQPEIVQPEIVRPEIVQPIRTAE